MLRNVSKGSVRGCKKLILTPALTWEPFVSAGDISGSSISVKASRCHETPNVPECLGIVFGHMFFLSQKLIKQLRMFSFVRATSYRGR